MQVLVSIPTHKRPALLRQCLESIERQEGGLSQIQVFVADNDPKGKAGVALTTEVAVSFRFPLTSMIVDEPGISAVRNAILDEARNRKVDFIAMIDDDETALPSWLSGLLKAQAAYSADAVAGPVLFDLQGDRAFDGAFWTDPRPSGPTDIVYATNNVLVSCAALERMGWPLFDAQFGLTGGGDLEWFTRIKKLGAQFAWNADALVTEIVPPERRKLSWLLKRQFRVGENQIRIARLHGDARQVLRLLIQAAGTLALSPLRVFGIRQPEKRNYLLRGCARAVGRIAGLLGVRYREYASQHESSAPSASSLRNSD